MVTFTATLTPTTKRSSEISSVNGKPASVVDTMSFRVVKGAGLITDQVTVEELWGYVEYTLEPALMPSNDKGSQ